MSILDTPIERRKVLKGFLIAGPTLAFAVRVGLDGPVGAFPITTEEQADHQDFVDHMVLFGATTPANYDLLIEIKPDGRVYAEIPKMDIGQGVLGASAQMIADHLDVAYENMDVILAPADQKWYTMQFTGASENVRTLWDPIAFAGAKMRGQLMAAASERMGVPVTQLRTEDGYVISTDGRKIAYGDLTADAAKLPHAKMAAPKSASDFKL
ncbi:MAG: molybdopterin cofactor-binding domain-containing protein, partial [bacterium]